MSDSNQSPAISSAPLAGVPGQASLETPQPNPDTSGAVASALHISHPLGEEKDIVSVHAPSLEPSGLPYQGELDAENESEAETLISSPVKKREALKKSKEQGIKRVAHEPGGTKDIQKIRDVVQEDRSVVKATDEDPESTDGLLGHVPDREGVQEDEDSDNLSDVSSVRSSFADTGRKGSTLSVNSHEDDSGSARGEEDDDQSEDNADERNGDDVGDGYGDMVNPRKRKHRESYLHASMEPPRRRRRASDDANAHTSGENGNSSPQLPRHRRTTSTQSNWTDAQRSVSGGNNNNTNNPGSTSGRQRRAATHFPVREAKATRNNWESDTSSETSHQHHLNRLTRNLNRSVSTPGRPMGRDHKRHVNKYGFTRLAEACENGDLDAVKEWREKDPEQLEQREFAGNTPLQVASLNGYPEIVSYLLAEKCNPHTANTDQDTPLIDAVENGHIEVVHLLLKAGVNPLRRNLKGQQALDLVTEETENAQDIRSTLREAIEKWRRNDDGQQQQKEGEPTQRPGPSKELHFLAYTPSNLLRLAGENDKTGIAELLQSQVQVNNDIVAAAAKTGDTFTVSMLLAELKPKDARKKPEAPLNAVVGTSHFEMVKYLTGADGFNPTWRSRSNGMTWYELAEHRQGPNWHQEKDMLKQLYDERMKTDRLSSSPVSKRENGKRRRTPLIQDDSDLEMEGMDSNEQARSRRRLVSKKVMREASNRHRSFSSSHSDNDHTESMDSSKVNSPDNKSLRPPPPRKPGRPRKASGFSQPSEPRPKRSRSPTARERRPPRDSPHIARSAGAAEEENSNHDRQKIKVEDSERQRTEAEAQTKAKVETEARAKVEAEAEADRKAELEAKIKAEKLIEEERMAEEKKKVEEEARRKEAERKAEEIRLQHQERIAKERRLKEERQIQALPSALRYVLGLTSASRPEKQKYIQSHFLPVQVVKHSDLGPTVEGNANADELWMLSYQAAAILTNAGAASLLDLPVDALAKQSSLTGIATLEVSLEQRRAMLPCLRSSSLVHASSSDEEDDLSSDDMAAELAMAEKTRLQIAEDRLKFFSMPSLRWIRFRDFYDTATSSGALDHPHLSGLELNYRFDCCLDSTSFSSMFKPERHNSASNGMKSEDMSETKASINGLKRKCEEDSVCRAGPGITTFTIVHD